MYIRKLVLKLKRLASVENDLEDQRPKKFTAIITSFYGQDFAKTYIGFHERKNLCEFNYK